MTNKKKEITIHSSAAEYLTYVASTGSNSDSFEMRYEDENIWLTQKMMATLYDVSVSAINQHLKRIFEDNELVEESVIKKYLITASDGKSYSTKHYNLQAIIAVGFKVNNDRAVRFRKWTGQIVKGICSLMNILNASLKIFVRFVCPSENFIRRLQISMPQRLITTKMPRLPGSFSKWYRIRCIGPYIGIQQRN